MEQLLLDPSLPTEQDTLPAEWLTENVLLALLNIPQSGLIGITSALLFAEQQQLCAYWWRDEKSDGQHAKLVDPQELRAAIGTIPLDSGFLPERVVRLGITRKGQYWMLVYQPPRTYQLLIERGERGRTPIELGLPGSLFFGASDTYYLWAVKSEPLTPETPLYRFPLPNVADTGQLCFGENTPPHVKWPSILPAFFLFLTSPFNGHWAQEKSLVYPGDIRERLLDLAALPGASFPEDELVPTLQYMNYGGTGPGPVPLETHLRRIAQVL